MKRTLAVLAALVALPLVAPAQKPVTQTDAIELTAKIEAIDHSARLVTLRDKDGESETIYCGPEVRRFDELKVGDTVTVRYYESIAYAIRKPGQPSGLPTATGATKITRGQGARPSGTIARQETATVTIKAIDPKTPSVTVLTEDGRTVSFKVEDKKNLKDVKVGDKVEVTYTEAAMISVK
jgi:Cu/Ag efflux protein CusF